MWGGKPDFAIGYGQLAIAAAESSTDAGCAIASRSLNSSVSTPRWVDPTRPGVFPIVGPQTTMQAGGGCQAFSNTPIPTSTLPLSVLESYPSVPDTYRLTCTWDASIPNTLFYFNYSYQVSIKDIGNFLNDVKKLIAKKKACFLYSGLVFRFIKASKNHAMLGVEEDSVSFDHTFFRNYNDSIPSHNADVHQEILQMAMLKYKAHIHFGKNYPVMFERVWENIGWRNTLPFERVRSELDPAGAFANEWTTKIFKGKTMTFTPGCAASGDCWCKNASHCAEGQICASGLVFRRARVCVDAKSRAPRKHKE